MAATKNDSSIFVRGLPYSVAHEVCACVINVFVRAISFAHELQSTVSTSLCHAGVGVGIC